MGRGSSLASQPAPTSSAPQPMPTPIAPQPTPTPGAPQMTPTLNAPQPTPTPGAPQPTPPSGAPHPSFSQPPAVPLRDMSLDDFIAMIRTVVRQEQSAGSTSASASRGPHGGGFRTCIRGPTRSIIRTGYASVLESLAYGSGCTTRPIFTGVVICYSPLTGASTTSDASYHKTSRGV